MQGKVRKVTPFEKRGVAVLEVEVPLGSYMTAAALVFQQIDMESIYAKDTTQEGYIKKSEVRDRLLAISSGLGIFIDDLSKQVPLSFSSPAAEPVLFPEGEGDLG